MRDIKEELLEKFRQEKRVKIKGKKKVDPCKKEFGKVKKNYQKLSSYGSSDER